MVVSSVPLSNEKLIILMLTLAWSSDTKFGSSCSILMLARAVVARSTMELMAVLVGLLWSMHGHVIIIERDIGLVGRCMDTSSLLSGI
jgi:hypothetical protein